MWWWHGNSNWGAWLGMTAGMAVFWGFVIWAFLSFEVVVGLFWYGRPATVIVQQRRPLAQVLSHIE